jgi:hypothetical protein
VHRDWHVAAGVECHTSCCARGDFGWVNTCVLYAFAVLVGQHAHASEQFPCWQPYYGLCRILLAVGVGRSRYGSRLGGGSNFQDCNTADLATCNCDDVEQLWP